MTMPFTVEDFFLVFRDYNAAIWPAQIVVMVLGLVPLTALFVGRNGAPRFAFAALSVLWAFTGIGYHLLFFARINPLARVFAALFVVQAVFFLASAIRPGDLQLGAGRNLRSLAGLLILFYAVVIYPLLGIRAGHGWMAGPMFGVAPCPTTIFTLGIFLMARGRWLPWLSVIPLLWSLVGLAAAVQLGIPEDLGLPGAGAVFLGMLGRRRHRS